MMIRNSGQSCILSQFTAVEESLFVTPWIAHWAPLSMGFSRQKYWSGLPLPSPGDLPNPGIQPRSPTLQANSLPFELPWKPTAVKSCCVILYFKVLTL